MGKETSTDYYEILQISPNADQETIDRIYRLLAKRYHPDNIQTGDRDKFDIITKAYRGLSDPQRRKEYDADYKAASHQKWESLFKSLPSDEAETDRKIYQEILGILYIARRHDAQGPGVGIVHLERQLGFPEKYLEFHIWYLKEKGWIQRLETGGFAITASGVDAVIEKNLLVRKDRLLPEVNDISNYEESIELEEAGRVSSNGTGHNHKAATRLENCFT